MYGRKIGFAIADEKVIAFLNVKTTPTIMLSVINEIDISAMKNGTG